MLRRILCFILIVGICTTIAYGEDVYPSSDTETFDVYSEMSNNTIAVPQIISGQERQTAYAAPASADSIVDAVAYTVAVSEWFEHGEDENVTYSATASLLSAVVSLDKNTGELRYVPDIAHGNSKVHIYVTAENEVGKSDHIDITVNVDKVPNAENSSFGTYQSTYFKARTGHLKQEVFAVINLNGNTFKNIYYNDEALIWNVDYTYERPYTYGKADIYESERVVLSESFYRDLDVGDYPLVFKLNGGEDLQFTLKVRNSNDDTYQVTCRSIGVVYFVEQLSCRDGESVPLATLTGNNLYEFGGWWSQAIGDEPSLPYTSETPITKDTVLIARWNKLVQCPETDEKNANLSVFDAKAGKSVMYPGFRRNIHDYYLDIRGEAMQLTDFSFEKENVMAILEYSLTGENEQPITDSENDSISNLSGLRTLLQKGRFDKLTVKITSPDHSITEEYRVHLRYDNEPLKHSVSFINNDKEHFRSEIIYGNSSSLPTVPTKSGYSFCGWFTEENGHGDEFTENTFVLSDMTVFACWEAKSYRRRASATNSGAVLAISGDREASPPPLKTDEREYKPYICGYADNTFRPEGLVTRAEAATILMRISEDYDSSSDYLCNFSDITDTDWHYNAVCYIDSKAALSQTSKSFCPEIEITRGEFCVLLTKLLDISLTETDIIFSDIDSTEEQQAAGMLYQMGVINGYGDNTFHPNSPISRAEVVTIINKIYKFNVESKNNNIFSDVSTEHWAYNDIILATIQ